MEPDHSSEPLLLRAGHLLMSRSIEGRTPFLHGAVPQLALRLDAESHDLLARSYSNALPTTRMIGTAIASRITGPLAKAYGRNTADPKVIRIGHASGCLSVGTNVLQTDETLRIKHAVIGRTARVFMEGMACRD